MHDRNKAFSFWLLVLRWLLLPVMLAICGLLIYQITYWLGRHGLPRRWIEPFAYFFSGLFGTLIMGFWSPAGRRTATLIAFVLSLLVAFNGLVGWHDPVTHEPTILPFSAGLTGWILAAALVFWHEHRLDGRWYVLPWVDRRKQEPLTHQRPGIGVSGNGARLARSANSHSTQMR